MRGHDIHVLLRNKKKLFRNKIILTSRTLSGALVLDSALWQFISSSFYFQACKCQPYNQLWTPASQWEHLPWYSLKFLFHWICRDCTQHHSQLMGSSRQMPYPRVTLCQLRWYLALAISHQYPSHRFQRHSSSRLHAIWCGPQCPLNFWLHNLSCLLWFLLVLPCFRFVFIMYPWA